MLLDPVQLRPVEFFLDALQRRVTDGAVVPQRDEAMPLRRDGRSHHRGLLVFRLVPCRGERLTRLLQGRLVTLRDPGHVLRLRHLGEACDGRLECGRSRQPDLTLDAAIILEPEPEEQPEPEKEPEPESGCGCG